MRRHRHAKIVATIGPASNTPEMLKQLFLAGADVFRLNFSHGTHDDHAKVYAHLREHHTFWDAFNGVVISGDIQLMKPEPEIFKHLLDAFKLRPEETVFIDDVLANIDGAKKLGLHTNGNWTPSCGHELGYTSS